MNYKLSAKISGYSLILMAIIAAYTFGYLYPIFIGPFNVNLIDTILQKSFMYNLMVCGILIIILLDFILSYTLYVYFKTINKVIALTSSILRLTYTFIFIIATAYLIKNNIVEYHNDKFIIYNFQQFNFIWSCGLIVFGMHLFLLGYLMKLHNIIPKTLWIITLSGAISYIILHLLIVIFERNEFINIIEMVVVMPMIMSELGLAIWLISKSQKN